MNNSRIIISQKKYFKKINFFHNNYYNITRSLSQFFWLIGGNNGIIRNYYILIKKKKILATIGFVKYKLFEKDNFVDAYKPEDVLSNIEGIKHNAFEKIHKKFEDKNKKKNLFLFNFSEIGWAYKKFNYQINFGDRSVFIKFYGKKSLKKILEKKGFSKLLIIILTNIYFIYKKFFQIINFNKKSKIRFTISKTCPVWTTSLFKSFVNYWKCLTVYRSNSFIKWRVFRNPFNKNYFVSIIHNKKPIGYFVFEKKKNILNVIDIILIPISIEFNSKYIINEIINYIDNYCINFNIKASKFELYLDFKLNKIIKKQLIKKAYLMNKKKSDFSYKNNMGLTSEYINKKLYLTNIFKAGR